MRGTIIFITEDGSKVFKNSENNSGGKNSANKSTSFTLIRLGKRKKRI